MGGELAQPDVRHGGEGTITVMGRAFAEAEQVEALGPGFRRSGLLMFSMVPMPWLG